MLTEPALDLLLATTRACRAHRQAHQLPPAPLGACNASDCPLHTGCPVLARQGAIITAVIEKELQAIDQMRAALRERTMTYQADLKDAVANRYHLDRQALYALPYHDWAALRERYNAEILGEEGPDA